MNSSLILQFQRGGLLLQDSGGDCIRPKGPILLRCEWLKVGVPCGAQSSDSLRTDLHVTSVEPSNHSRGKLECPFRYWLSHLVTQRSQWQSEFESESWNICTCTHTSMMEFRASGTLGKLTDLYIQYIFFEQSLAKLLRLALNLPYSWLSFPRSCDYLPSCLRLICDISFSLNTYPGLLPLPFTHRGRHLFPPSITWVTYISQNVFKGDKILYFWPFFIILSMILQCRTWLCYRMYSHIFMLLPSPHHHLFLTAYVNYSHMFLL